MRFIPDLKKRWVTPWIAIDWTMRNAKGLVYHFTRDFLFTTLLFWIGYFAGVGALMTPYIVAWGAFLQEVAQGTMLFERDGKVWAGYLDPTDLVFTPIVAAGAVFANFFILGVSNGFDVNSLLINYGIYILMLIPILIINLVRGTPPELLK